MYVYICINMYGWISLSQWLSEILQEMKIYSS